MRLEVLDNHVAVAASGDTHPLLFVHGAGCNAAVWQDSLQWFAGEGIPARAVSLRGHGKSEGIERLDDFGIMDYVEDVRQTASAMERPPVLVGHSMGGLVVQKVLEWWQGPGAILLASVPVGGMARDGLRMYARWPGHFTLALVRRSMLEIYRTDESTRWLLFSESSDPALVTEARRLLGEESWRAVVDMSLRVRPVPKNVSSPILVLGASEDKMVSPASNRRTAASYRTGIRIFDECGHMMMLEKPWPLIAETIRDWCLELSD